MRIFALLISFYFGVSNSHATTETPQTAAEKASIAVALAQKGEYGRLSKVQYFMIKEAHSRIEQLAQANASFEDFDSDEKRIFDHASERINRLTRRTDENRMVCKRVVKTGTRLAESECLTVAQREARAKGSRERVEKFLTGVCAGQDVGVCGGNENDTVVY